MLPDHVQKIEECILAANVPPLTNHWAMVRFDLIELEQVRARVAEAERLLQMAASVCDSGAFMLASEIREWLAGNKSGERNGD